MLALAIAAQAVAPVPVFAPPLDTPIEVVTERSQRDGAGEVRRFETRRRIVFRRDADGLTAEVTMLSATADPDATEAWAGLFEAGYSVLTGHRIVMQLDSRGTVTAIDDMAPLWDRFCRGVADLAASRRIAAPSEERAALAARLLGPLRALPPARQVAIFASLVSELVAGDAFAAGPGTATRVRVPGRTPFGGAATLDGVQTIEAADGLLRSATHATGTVPIPQSPAGATARMEMTIDRRADPETGLIRSAREIVRTRLADGDETAVRTATTTTTVTVGDGHGIPIPVSNAAE